MRSDYQNMSVFRPELISSNGLAFQGNQIGSVYPSDWANVSPRVGFSYSPKSARGVVLRGGFGIFFDTPNANPFLDNRPGNNAPNGVEGNPGGPSPVYTLSAYGGTIVPGQSIFPVVTPTTTSLCHPGSPCGVCRPSVLYQNTTWAGVTERPYLSQYPQYGDINQIESIGTSNYNSLQSVLKIRSYHGLASHFSHTWGHNLDEVTAYRGQLPQDSTNFKGDYGNSDFDTRNTFVAYANYDVSRFRGPRLITDGWQLNSVVTLKGGEPVNLVTNTDTTGENEYTQRPNIIGNPFAGITHAIQGGVVQWVNPAAFANPAFGTYGNYTRNSIYGPGFEDVDLSLFKHTPITERITTQFRVEMFNLFNHLNLANPGPEQLGNDAFGTSSFGQIGSTIGAGNYAPGIGPGESFNVQLALKIIF